jgi:copper chaperone
MYTFKIPKMSCGGCINTIKKVLMKLDENALISFELPSKQVSVTTNQPMELLKSTLAEAGYPIDGDN